MFLKSYPLGVVGLAETHVRNDPPDSQDLDVLRKAIRPVLEEVKQDIASAPCRMAWDGSAPWTLIGTAGTVTSLAILAQNLDTYDAGLVTGYELSGNAVENILARLASLTVKQRAALFPLARSEERRVGKECRSRLSPYH